MYMLLHQNQADPFSGIAILKILAPSNTPINGGIFGNVFTIETLPVVDMGVILGS